jgi:hypothetical protein
MIQRIQTVYLFLAAIAGLLTFFLPFTHFTAEDVKLAEYAMFGLFNVQSDVLETSGTFTFPAWVLGSLSVLLPAIGIALYKNRPLQMKIVRLAYLVDLAYVVYLFFAVDRLYTEYFDSTSSVLYHVGFYLPVAAFAFCFLAIRGIKKDEALVKSLDRIR